MTRAVALLLTVSMLGCFPHNAQNRTIAKLSEGGAVLAGIAMEAVLNTGADCDAMSTVGAPPDSNCHSKQSVLGSVGVALILGGLLGFVATVSTAEDDPPTTPPIEIKAAKPAEKPAVRLPPGVTPTPVATPPAATAIETPPAPPAPPVPPVPPVPPEPAAP